MSSRKTKAIILLKERKNYFLKGDSDMRKALKLGLAVFVMAFTTILLGCSDGSGGGGGSSKRTVSKYGYKLNYNTSYHRVIKYIAIDNEDDTYSVSNCSIHYFSISNSNYKNRSGGELCDMIKTNAITPSSSQDYTLEKDATTTTTYPSTGKVETFYLPKGLNYTIYYYF